MYHHKSTNQVFHVEGLESPDLPLAKVLKQNEIVDAGEDSLKKAGALLEVSLEIQSDTVQKISKSVDQNLDKYLQISQTFSESKQLLDSNVKTVKGLLTNFEEKQGILSQEIEDLNQIKYRVCSAAINVRNANLLTRIFEILKLDDLDTKDLYKLQGRAEKLKLCEEALQQNLLFRNQQSESVLSSLRETLASKKAALLQTVKDLFQQFLESFASLPSDLTSQDPHRIRPSLFLFKLRKDSNRYMSLYRSLNSEQEFEVQLDNFIFGHILEHSDDSDFDSLLQHTTSIYIQAQTSLSPQLLTWLQENTFMNVIVGLFFKNKQFFPLNKIDVFSSNFSSLYSLILEIYSGLSGSSIPEEINSQLRKKQGVIYQSYVIQVIKKIERLIIVLKKAEKGSDLAIIQEQMSKKFNRSELSEVLADIFDQNFDSKMFTSSLLGKIISLNIRMVQRVRSFISEESTLDSKHFAYYSSQIFDFSINFEQKLPSKMRQTLSEILSLEELETHLPSITAVLLNRVSMLKDTVINSLIKQSLKNQELSLEAEVSTVAMKLQITGSSNGNPSLVIPKAKSAYLACSKMLQSEFQETLQYRTASESYKLFLDSQIEEEYQKQIDNALETEEKSIKASQAQGGQSLLSELLKTQLKLDKEAIASLILKD